MEKNPKNGKKKSLPVFNILLVAFVAITTVQLSHEGCHAIISILVGAKLEAFHLMGILHSWPGAAVGSAWQEGAITGSAALLNIAVAGICLFLFYRKKFQDRPFLRLYIFFVAAYSWFMGFGYLFIDPLFAYPESTGDWAKVIMLLGGSWAVRVPILTIGGLGIVYGYFWVGKAAMHFTAGDMEDKANRNRTGLILCIYPYIVLNLIYTIFGFFHPLGWPGFFIVFMQVWMGYSGFFWAFMINYIWSEYKGPFKNETSLPDTELNKIWLLLALATLVISIILLIVPLLLLG